MQRTLPFLAVLLILCGCSTPKPFSALPIDQQQAARFASCKEAPQTRFVSFGAKDARTFGAMGGLVGVTVGLAVADSIEKNNAALKVIRATTGEFEKALIEEQFRSRLPAEVREQGSNTNGHLQLCGLVVGLYEVERDRFAPFARGTASLRSPNGKELWKVDVRSISTKPHTLEVFGKQPDLYRKDFDEVAADLAAQLVEGPVREIRD